MICNFPAQSYPEGRERESTFFHLKEMENFCMILSVAEQHGFYSESEAETDLLPRRILHQRRKDSTKEPLRFQSVDWFGEKQKQTDKRTVHPQKSGLSLWLVTILSVNTLLPLKGIFLIDQE